MKISRIFRLLFQGKFKSGFPLFFKETFLKSKKREFLNIEIVLNNVSCDNKDETLSVEVKDVQRLNIFL